MLLDPVPLGAPLPYPSIKHAITSSLPTWLETFRHKADDPEINAHILTGYPRYVVHESIEQLAAICERNYAANDASKTKRCLLFVSIRAGTACRAFLSERGIASDDLVGICARDSDSDAIVIGVFFDADAYKTARLFWQHTGFGISSRFAEYVLARVEQDEDVRLAPLRDCTSARLPLQELRNESELDPKVTIRARIAQLISSAEIDGRIAVDERDVFLFPTGMTAIWTVHQLCMAIFGAELPTVCFAFPYCDTLKVLRAFGSRECLFYPDGSDTCIDALDHALAARKASSPTLRPVSALFTEFPTNPLLHAVDMQRLRALADKYDFPIVVDDTIGNCVNVHVLPFADVVVTSLSKLFSGRADVMGGSVVINPQSKYRAQLHGLLRATFEDDYFMPDAIIMERNSRDFSSRVRQIDDNALAAVAYLRAQTHIISAIYHPSTSHAKAHYDACRVRRGGYGGLLSLTFISPAAAHAFFDVLPCAKGPSLGTSFTLACCYTVLGHFHELEWAARHGVDPDLVRISVGSEEREALLSALRIAVEAAERVADGHEHEHERRGVLKAAL